MLQRYCLPADVPRWFCVQSVSVSPSFNPPNCVFRSEDACADRTATPGCPQYTDPNPCATNPTGFYPIDCENYVFCLNYEPFYQRCDEGQVFHPTKYHCLPLDDVPGPCGYRPDGGWVIVCVVSFTCFAVPEFSCDGLVPAFYGHQEDCRAYYNCEEDGSLWVFQCSVGFAFSVAQSECLPQFLVHDCRPTPVESELCSRSL